MAQDRSKSLLYQAENGQLDHNTKEFQEFTKRSLMSLLQISNRFEQASYTQSI